MCALFVCTVSVEATPVVIPLDDSGRAAVIDDVMLYETREVGAPAAGDVFETGRIAGRIMIVTDPEMGVGPNFRFGLKEIPTVPEPTTLALLGIGGLMVLNRKRRRQA